MHGRNEAIHAARKRPFSGENNVQDNRTDVANATEGNHDVDFGGVSPRRTPESATFMGQAGTQQSFDPRAPRD